MKPRYPIYIISKGRWENPLTAKTLEAIGVDYKIVIEPPEEAQYRKTVPGDRILLLPFWDLKKGSIPARNWIWDHSIAQGAERHWILDDNIRGIWHYNMGRRTRMRDASVFCWIERFVDRYANVALAGMQYGMFGGPSYNGKLYRCLRIPVVMNTRIYSCILIDNKIPFRWRGRYNEDTDLSLRVLKAGYCTILFLKWMIGKIQTLLMKGGNDYLYDGDGRLRMAVSLLRQHPDVVKISWKWGRPQHIVNYRPFRKNRLIRRESSIAIS